MDDRYFGQTHTQTDRHTYTQVILYLSNAMHCSGQTITYNQIHAYIPLSFFTANCILHQFTARDIFSTEFDQCSIAHMLSFDTHYTMAVQCCSSDHVDYLLMACTHSNHAFVHCFQDIQ